MCVNKILKKLMTFVYLIFKDFRCIPSGNFSTFCPSTPSLYPSGNFSTFCPSGPGLYPYGNFSTFCPSTTTTFPPWAPTTFGPSGLDLYPSSTTFSALGLAAAAA